MKKILFVILVIFLPCLGLANNNGFWKGYVDANGGGSHSNKHFILSPLSPYDSFVSESWGLTFGMNFTGGYQITPQWFSGVGFGWYAAAAFFSYNTFDSRVERDTDFYALYVPVYANIRWTTDIRRKLCPFIDLKIGYQFGGPCDAHTVRYMNGVYIVPSAGIRLGKATGFNLGIGYNVSIGRKIYESWGDKFVGESHQGVFLLILGVDF